MPAANSPARRGAKRRPGRAEACGRCPASGHKSIGPEGPPTKARMPRA
ncbi:DUF6053 domain-containing protein [Lysobacter enzymogenes]